MARWLSRCLTPAVSLFFFVAPAIPIEAAESVAPGEVLLFHQAEGGARECRIKDLDVTLLCDLLPWRAVIPIPGVIPPRWVTTYSGPSSNHVGAAYYSVASLASGIPHYATGKIFNHFEIEDDDQTQDPIDVQISIDYHVDAFLAGLLNYTTEVSVSLDIEEIVEAGRYEGVGSLELFSRDRSGDQGVTDVSLGSAAYDLNGESARFTVKLRRGAAYRIVFKAEAFGVPALAESQSSVEAWWTKIAVVVDGEDASALIRRHDEDIKAVIRAHDVYMAALVEEHDTDLKASLAQHDSEIKALLATVVSDLEEIKRLLSTPPGRRPGFPQKETKSR